jgi:3' exoribonuclease, RNase T-like
MATKIGILDSETLSLKTRAVVYEVSLLTVVVNPYYRQSDDRVQPELWTRRIDILEQMAVGRVADPETLQWQFKTFGPEFSKQVYGEGPLIQRPLLFLRDLRELCADLDELWIYKASFDHAVLHTLAEDFDLPDPQNVWGHNIERCLKTVRLSLGLKEKTRKEGRVAAHRSDSDVLWNWEVLQAYGHAKNLRDLGELGDGFGPHLNLTFEVLNPNRK